MEEIQELVDCDGHLRFRFSVAFFALNVVRNSGFNRSIY